MPIFSPIPFITRIQLSSKFIISPFFERFNYRSIFLTRGYSSLSSSDKVSHYDVLGLNTSASAIEIKRKYYELSKLYHPDANRSRDPDFRRAAEKKYFRIKEAYEVLGDKQKRASFDMELSKRHGATTFSDRSTRYSGYKGTTYSSFSSHKRTRPHTYHYYNKHHEYSQAKKEVRDTDSIKAGYKTGSNYDVPHFDFDKHYRQQRSYELHRKKQQMKADQKDKPKASSFDAHRSDHDFIYNEYDHVYNYNPYKTSPKPIVRVTPIGIMAILGGLVSVSYFVIKTIF